jgi:hypothetical protein
MNDAINRPKTMQSRPIRLVEVDEYRRNGWQVEQAGPEKALAVRDLLADDVIYGVPI